MVFFFLILKTIVITIFAIGIRGTVPRYRYDQFTKLNWKHTLYFFIMLLVLDITYIFLLYN